ncbi:MAG: DUF3168 domain-containing protein [Gammaproteobacteria bacterium]
MSNPAFALAAASSAVKALLGTDPVRFYLFGEATQNTPLPYAVWQTVYGSPENLLNGVPNLDRWGVQVDAYAKTPTASRAIQDALRDAFEPTAYVVAWNGEFLESDTGLYRCSFTVEFMSPRI